MRATAVVLAAGRSTRMGTANKLTMPLEGKPVVRYVVEALIASSVEEVLVVTGHEAVGVRNALRDCTSLRFVQNPDFASGMASSIVSGVEAASEADALFICLGDMPGLSPLVVDTLLGCYAASRLADPRDSIVVPTFNGRAGHPVLFGANHFSALGRLTGDRGARQLLIDHARFVSEVAFDDLGVCWDIDEPADLGGGRRDPDASEPV